ncbi:phage portal protein, partial [Bacillus cereus]
MGLRDRFSNYLYRKLEKRGLFDDILGNSIRYGGRYVSSDNILESSDVYELLQDISNQMMLAEIVVEDKEGKEIKDDFALKV